MPRYVREGLRVVLNRIPGISEAGVLDDPYAFQLPPRDDFSTEHSFTHNTYETLSAGQHSRRGGVNLRTSSWSSLVVDVGIDDRGLPLPSFVTLADSPDIEDLCAGLIEIVESGSPFLYTAAHTLPHGGITNWGSNLAGPEAQWPAVLTRVRISEQAGEGDTRYFDLDFQEYRDPVVGRSKLGRGKKSGTGTKGTKWPAYVVLRSDGFAYDSATRKRIGTAPATLSQIARHYYHDPSMARLVAYENHIKAGMNDRLVYLRDQGGVFLLGGSATRKLKVPKPAVAHV